MDFLSPGGEAAFATYSRGEATLESLYGQAVKKGLIVASSLADFAPEEFVEQAAPRPPGYCAQTVLHFGRLGVATLLDYGATCNAMPEEVAMTIISHALGAYPDRMVEDYPSSGCTGIARRARWTE